MRIRNIQSRVANLEQLLGRKGDEKSTEFNLKVSHWLVRNHEYRSLAGEIFERMCETEQPGTQKLFEAVITVEERDRIRRLTAEAEASIRAEFSSRK